MKFSKFSMNEILLWIFYLFQTSQRATDATTNMWIFGKVAQQIHSKFQVWMICTYIVVYYLLDVNEAWALESLFSRFSLAIWLFSGDNKNMFWYDPEGCQNGTLSIDPNQIYFDCVFEYSGECVSWTFNIKREISLFSVGKLPQSMVTAEFATRGCPEQPSFYCTELLCCISLWSRIAKLNWSGVHLSQEILL